MSERIPLSVRSARMAKAAMRRCQEVRNGGKAERCALNLSSIDKRFRTCPFHEVCEKATFRGWVTVIRFRLKKEKGNNAES